MIVPKKIRPNGRAFKVRRIIQKHRRPDGIWAWGRETPRTAGTLPQGLRGASAERSKRHVVPSRESETVLNLDISTLGKPFGYSMDVMGHRRRNSVAILPSASPKE